MQLPVWCRRPPAVTKAARLTEPRPPCLPDAAAMFFGLRLVFSVALSTPILGSTIIQTGVQVRPVACTLVHVCVHTPCCACSGWVSKGGTSHGLLPVVWWECERRRNAVCASPLPLLIAHRPFQILGPPCRLRAWCSPQWQSLAMRAANGG